MMSCDEGNVMRVVMSKAKRKECICIAHARISNYFKDDMGSPCAIISHTQYLFIARLEESRESSEGDTR